MYLIIKFVEQIAEEIEKERKKKPLDTKCVTGEAHEKWMITTRFDKQRTLTKKSR